MIRECKRRQKVNPQEGVPTMSGFETTMNSFSEFLHQLQNDSEFIERARMCTSDAERAAFLWHEGFKFTAAELKVAIKFWAFINREKPIFKTKDHRKIDNYNLFLKVTEINGQPLADATVLDICVWGGQIESLTTIPPDCPVEVSFTLDGEGKERQKKIRLSGKVFWLGHRPVSKRHRNGAQSYESFEPRHHEGNLPEGRVRSTIQQHSLEISDKEFLNIREFALKLGVHWFTVWRWTVENRIKFKQVRSGCKILIPASELGQFQTSSD
jgi:hypothetical protein